MFKKQDRKECMFTWTNVSIVRMKGSHRNKKRNCRKQVLICAVSTQTTAEFVIYDISECLCRLWQLNVVSIKICFLLITVRGMSNFL